MAFVDELHTPDHFSLEKQKNPEEFRCSVPFITVIMKSHLFKIVWVFIPNRIRRRKVCVSVLFGCVSYQLWQNSLKYKFSTIWPAEISVVTYSLLLFICFDFKKKVKYAKK